MKDKNFFFELGKLLKEIRKKREISLSTVSSDVKISVGHLSNIENYLGNMEGVGFLRKEQISKLLNYYKLSIEEKELFYDLYLNSLLKYSIEEKYVKEIKKIYKIK